MAEISNYYENWIINHMFRGVAFTPPAMLFVALYTVAPTDVGGGTEVSGGSYVRQSFALTAASNGSSFNIINIDFPAATADWGTVVACGIFDAATAGNLLMWSLLNTSRTVGAGDIFRINAGDLSVVFD